MRLENGPKTEKYTKKKGRAHEKKKRDRKVVENHTLYRWLFLFAWSSDYKVICIVTLAFILACGCICVCVCKVFSFVINFTCIQLKCKSCGYDYESNWVLSAGWRTDRLIKSWLLFSLINYICKNIDKLIKMIYIYLNKIKYIYLNFMKTLAESFIYLLNIN